MGWKLNALAFMFAIWAINVGALIIGFPILLYLFYKFWSNRQSKPVGMGRSHWMIYLGAFLLLLSLVAIAEHGTLSPVVFSMSGIILLALGLFPGLVQEFAEKVAGPSSELFWEMSGRSRVRDENTSCVELTKIPLNYLDPKKNDPKEALQRFQRLAQTLAELGSPVELRLVFSKSSGRILFATPGRDSKERPPGLLRVMRSQLPDFGPQITECADAEDQYSVSVEGTPQPSIDPISTLARFFVENRLEGSYCARISSAWVNPVSRWLAGRKQRKIAESSGYQHVDDDRTTTVVDHPKQVELENSVKGLERLLARRPVRVSVQVSAADDATATQAANILAGALSSQRKIDGLEVRRPRRFRGQGWHRSTLMIPSEAAPYLWLPQVSMGLSVAPSAEFHAPPLTEGEVVLGEVVSLSGRNGQKARVPLDQLAKHVFVTGMTGSGKTTSCFSLLLQLHRLKVPFLVVEPVKSEYRSLLAAVPELQVFTIGDEETAPLRLNIFEPPPGVKVQAHLENLEAVWNASFVSYAPLPYVIKQVFAEAYRACNWDLARNVRGRAVTFDDVKVQVERVVRGLGYERNVTMDVEAALKTRLTSLSLGSKGPLFGSGESTPLDAVLSKPTVIELKEIQNDEEKAFVAALILMNVASGVQSRGGSKHLRHFTLIEEAHRLLPNVSTEKGDPESADPRRRMVEQFGNMLAELRAYGEGLAVVEQIPTKILPDAIKNTATKMVHRVPAEDDRRVMAGAMNATKQQSAVFTSLQPGEAILSIEGHPVPVRVEVDNVVAKLGIPVGEVSEWDVNRRMEDFYVRNPLPIDPPLAKDARIRMLVDSEQFRVEFLRAYRVWLAKGRTEPLRDFLLQTASELAHDREGKIDAAAALLQLATGFYLPLNAELREEFPRRFRKQLEVASRA